MAFRTLNLEDSPPLDDEAIVAAMRLEYAIIRQCEKGYYAFQDADVHDRLKRTEQGARDRLWILRELTQ